MGDGKNWIYLVIDIILGIVGLIIIALGMIFICTINTSDNNSYKVQAVCITCMSSVVSVVLIFAMYFTSKFCVKKQKLYMLKLLRYYMIKETVSGTNSKNTQDTGANKKDLFRDYCNALAEI